MNKSPAHIQVLGRSYEVSEFNGSEELFTPTLYTVCFETRDELEFNELLKAPLSLSYEFFGHPQRTIKLVVVRCQSSRLEHGFRYRLNAAHPLYVLQLCGQAETFLQSDDMSVCLTVLERHGLRAHVDTSRLVKSQQQRELIRQAESESDYDFFERLLERNHCFYKLADEGTILLYDNFHSYPAASVPYVEHEYDNAGFNGGNNSLYALTFDSKLDMQARSAVSSFETGHLVTVHSEVFGGYTEPVKDGPYESETFNLELLIHAVLHNYHPDNTPVYQNTLNLAPTGQGFRDRSENTSQETNLHGARVEAHADSAVLDTLGRYRYRAHHELHDYDKGSASIAIPRISPYAGAGGKGFHFPLKDGQEALIAYQDNNPEKPLMLASFYNSDFPSPINNNNPHQNQIVTGAGHYLKFDDKKEDESITLGAKESYLALIAKKSNHQMQLVSKGIMQHRAGEDIRVDVGSHDAYTGGSTRYQVMENYIMESEEGNLAFYSEESSTVTADEIKIEAGKNIEFTSENTSIENKNSILFHSLEGNINIHSERGALVIEADTLKIKSDTLIELGTPEAFIRLEPNSAHIEAGSMNSASADNFQIVGQVQYFDEASPIQSKYIAPPTALQTLPNFANKPIPSINFLSWSGQSFEAGKALKPVFEVAGFEGDEQGMMEVYRCVARDVARINLEALKDDCDNEEYELVDTLNFELGDAAIYLDKYQAENTKGDALIQLHYNPRPMTPRKTSEQKAKQADEAPANSQYLKYFRFKIKLAGKNHYQYSNPMQLHKSVSIEHAGPIAATHALLVRKTVKGLLAAEREEKLPLKDGKLLLTQVPYDCDNEVYFYKDTQDLEVLNEDSSQVLPFYTLRVGYEQDDSVHQIKSIMPPVIINFRNDSSDADCYARDKLSEDELNYFIDNGNNLTLFIHGFNVAYGEFSPHYEKFEVSERHINGVVTAGYHGERLEAKPTRARTTVYRNYQEFNKQHPILKPDFDAKQSIINGSGMHNWLMHIEDNLNRAAGFDKDYNDFSRAAFIAWQGDPSSPADYMEAVEHSKQLGPRLAKFLLDIKKRAPTLELNLIAHSQGNGVMISAMDYLGEHHPRVKLDHCFFWDAAIPADALSSKEALAGLHTDTVYTLARIDKIRRTELWFMPYANQASKKITVLYSHNDNVVGPIPTEEEFNLEGLDMDAVMEHKPDAELLPAALLTCLNLGSLYEAAMRLGVPVSQLASGEGADKAWELWRIRHQDNIFDKGDGICKATKLKYQDTLDKQVALYHQHGVIKAMLEELHKFIETEGAYIQKILSHVESLKLRYSSKTAVLLTRNRATTGVLVALLSLLGNSNQVTRLVKISLKSLIDSIYKPHKELIDKLLTFAAATLIRAPRTPNDYRGMGWMGVDKPTFNELNRTLSNINTTKWIFHHSDMKIPSKDVMDKIYKRRIVDIINFGSYPKKQEGL